MPGRNPAEAVKEYREPLQQSLSCVSKCVLKVSGYKVGVLNQVTLSEPVAEVITKAGELLYLSFLQDFSIIEPLIPFRFKIRTHSYYYGLEDSHHREIVIFHWHPEGPSPVQHPHLHIGNGAGNFRSEIGAIHFPTHRLAFEEFCQLLINDFGVERERADAQEVLVRNLKAFKDHKTW